MQKSFLFIHIHSKLGYSNYSPVSLLSNLEKILEKLMYRRIFKFFTDNNFIYPYKLVSDKGIPQHML